MPAETNLSMVTESSKIMNFS